MLGIFETKVDGGKMDGDIARHHTLEEALKGHKKMVVLATIVS